MRLLSARRGPLLVGDEMAADRSTGAVEQLPVAGFWTSSAIARAVVTSLQAQALARHAAWDAAAGGSSCFEADSGGFFRKSIRDAGASLPTLATLSEAVEILLPVKAAGGSAIALMSLKGP